MNIKGYQPKESSEISELNPPSGGSNVKINPIKLAIEYLGRDWQYKKLAEDADAELTEYEKLSKALEETMNIGDVLQHIIEKNEDAQLEQLRDDLYEAGIIIDHLRYWINTYASDTPDGLLKEAENWLVAHGLMMGL